MTNCPRCNMLLAQGAQVCPNCQLNLMQYYYQQQFQNPGLTNTTVETTQEKKYRILLVIIAFLGISSLVTRGFPDLLRDFIGVDMYTIMKPLQWIANIAWAGTPLVIALLLPKTNKIRVLLIVLGSIYALYDLYQFVYWEFMYSYESIDYNF